MQKSFNFGFYSTYQMSDTEIADVSQSLVDPVEKTQDRDDQDQRSDPSLSEVEENPSPEESRAGEDYSDSSSTQEGEDHDHDDDEENHFLEDLPKETPISTTSPKDGAGPKFRRKKRKISSRPTAVASKKSPPAPVPKLNLEYEKYLKGKAIEIKGSLERAAPDPLKDIETFRRYAIARSGLVSDDLRRKIWPLLASIAISNDANLPSQEDCEKHPEYNQVVLDVNRSLKRFPPGIAETERPGLQDQLTRLIVRVLLKHPHLHYYQGYHDVAITFLLVVGEEMGYHIMEKLSMTHLQSYMAKTMEETTYLLNYMYPIVST